MNLYWNIILIALTTALDVVPAPASVDLSVSPFHSFPSQDYVIYTDLGADQAREAQVRMTPMKAEYRRWTGFVSGDPARKLPLYLFGNSEDFYAFGGPQSASGAFIGNALLAIAGTGNWHTLQHEGFHQFVAAAPGHDLPPWVEEGWSEFFGESVFSGDGYTSGVIPAWRLRRLRSEIVNHRLKPFSELLGLSAKEWNDQLLLANYDQAWSMVQFFAQGANGRYRFAFAEFVNALRLGHPADKAWSEHFPAPDRIQRQWEDEWLGLNDAPTRALYAQAAVAALSSSLGRAIAQGQRFGSFADFSFAVESGLLHSSGEAWLPPSVAFDAMVSLRGLGANCTFQPGDGVLPRIVAVLPEHVRITGSFLLRAGRVRQIHADIVTFPGREAPPAPLLPPLPARNAE